MRFLTVILTTAVLFPTCFVAGLPTSRVQKTSLNKAAILTVTRDIYLPGTGIHDEVARSAGLEASVTDRALKFLQLSRSQAASAFKALSLGLSGRLSVRSALSSALPLTSNAQSMRKRQNNSCGNGSQCGSNDNNNQGGQGNTVGGGSSSKNLKLELGLGIGIGLPGAIGAIFGMYKGVLELKDRRRKRRAEEARAMQSRVGHQHVRGQTSSPMEQHYYGRSALAN